MKYYKELIDNKITIDLYSFILKMCNQFSSKLININQKIVTARYIVVSRVCIKLFTHYINFFYNKSLDLEKNQILQRRN